MQNSNASDNPSPTPTPQSIREEALARDYERVGARIHAGEWISDNVFVALIERADEHSDKKPRPHASAEPHTAAEPRNDGARPGGGDPTGGLRVTLDELLPVFRDPIAWALARAERHAQGDPLNLAALGRVRATYQSRMAWIGSGGTVGTAKPTFRLTDVLTAAGLLIGSIDPSFAQRTSIGVRESLLDTLAEMIPLGQACAPGAAATPPPPVVPCCCSNHIPDAPAPPVSRPAAAPCCCRHGHRL